MTLQEKLNIDKVMSNWKKEALDRNAYPIIAISMRKSGGGKDVFIHGPYDFNIPPEKLKEMLQALIDRL